MRGTPARSAQTSSCSMAAARKVSPAPISTLLPAWRYLWAILPMVVVLPTPFTPTTMMTWGWLGSGASKSAGRSSVPSSMSFAISSRISPFSSWADTYWSCSTRASTWSMMSSVVSTPTSLVIRTSSSSSRTSASTVSLPRTMRSSLPKKLSRVLSSPSSSFSCSSSSFQFVNVSRKPIAHKTNPKKHCGPAAVRGLGEQNRASPPRRSAWPAGSGRRTGERRTQTGRLPSRGRRGRPADRPSGSRSGS